MDSLSPDDLHCVLYAVFEGTQESYRAFRRIVKEQIHIMTVCKTWRQTVFKCIETCIQQRFQCILEDVFAIRFYGLVHSKRFDDFLSTQKLREEMTVSKNVRFLQTAHMNALDVILPDEKASMRDVCILTYNMRRIHNMTTICLVYCPCLDFVEQWKGVAQVCGLNVCTQATPWHSIKDCDIVIGTYKFMRKKRIPESFITVLHQYEKFPKLVAKIIEKKTYFDSTVYVTNVLNSFRRIDFHKSGKHWVSDSWIKEGIAMQDFVGPRWNHIDTDVCASVIECLRVT